MAREWIPKRRPSHLAVERKQSCALSTMHSHIAAKISRGPEVLDAFLAEHVGNTLLNFADARRRGKVYSRWINTELVRELWLRVTGFANEHSRAQYDLVDAVNLVSADASDVCKEPGANQRPLQERAASAIRLFALLWPEHARFVDAEALATGIGQWRSAGKESPWVSLLAAFQPVAAVFPEAQKGGARGPKSPDSLRRMWERHGGETPLKRSRTSKNPPVQHVEQAAG
jgi:hypothetical protein